MSLNAFIALHEALNLPVFARYPPAVKVAVVLANAASDDGFEFCSVAKLAARAGMSAAAFHLNLQRLRAAGWVENVPAKKQPPWVRKRVGGTRVAVRRVPHLPTLGSEELPTLGSEELPTLGRTRNLMKGRMSPDARESRTPDARENRTPDARETDPACAPACDPDTTPVGPAPSAQALVADSTSAAGRLRDPAFAGPDEVGESEGPADAPRSGVSQIAERVAADLVQGWLDDMDALGRPVHPSTRAAVERNAAKVIAGPTLRKWMRAGGLVDGEGTITAEQVGDAIWDAWLRIRQSGHHVAEGLALPWLLSRPQKCVEHAMAQREADASAQAGPVAEARSIIAWWEGERARRGMPADLTADDAERRLVNLLVRGDEAQRAKAPTWIREQLGRVTGDPAARLGWLSYSFTNMAGAGGPSAVRRPVSAEEVLAARAAAVPLGRPVPMRIIDDEGDET